jgi:peptidoglycan/xylan/chitin deacetylase (PgdA/CDA1 family)
MRFVEGTGEDPAMALRVRVARTRPDLQKIGRAGRLRLSMLCLLAALVAAGCDEESPLRPDALRESGNASELVGPADSSAVIDSVDAGENPRPVVLDDDGVSTGESADKEIDPRQIIAAVEVATWPADKVAACPIAFDDTRPSHYLIAAPEMEARGFRGTFNLVTGQISQWDDWVELHEHGHELSNHTRHHYYFSDLSEEEVYNEVAGGVDDLVSHIPGMSWVPSFAYPGGDCPAWSEPIVALFHVSARGGHGVESADPVDMMRIQGCGYYAPFSLEEMNQNLDTAIATGGWYLPYYHSITNSDQGSYLYCPRVVFTAHLDYIRSREQDVWVAPQGEVARYILERQGFCYEFIAEEEIFLRINTGLDPGRFNMPLTVLLTLRSGLGPRVLTVGNEEFQLGGETTTIMVDLVPGKLYPVHLRVHGATGDHRADEGGGPAVVLREKSIAASSNSIWASLTRMSGRRGRE